VPGASSKAYLSELRLHLDALDPAELRPDPNDRPKVRRAFSQLAALAEEQP
jgi:hypothetical protein